MTRFRFMDVPIDSLTMSETVAQCLRLIEERRFAQHVVLNAGKVVMMHDRPELKQVISGCDLVNADGQSVVWAGRVLGIPFAERVAGIDLMAELLGECERRGLPVYFLGATEEVLGAFLQAVGERWPSLEVAGSRNGYFDDDRAVACAVRESGARVLFVGISSPRKEFFLCAQADELDGVFAMGVGGSFDVIAGKTSRAPLWMQRSGLEWFYRLALEPRRMWRRYLLGNLRFCSLVIRELASGRRAVPIESGAAS